MRRKVRGPKFGGNRWKQERDSSPDEVEAVDGQEEEAEPRVQRGQVAPLIRVRGHRCRHVRKESKIRWGNQRKRTDLVVVVKLNYHDEGGDDDGESSRVPESVTELGAKVPHQGFDDSIADGGAGQTEAHGKKHQNGVDCALVETPEVSIDARGVCASPPGEAQDHRRH